MGRLRMKNFFKSETCVKKGNVLYFFLEEVNLLCSFDLVTKESKIISSIPLEKIYEKRICGKLLIWKNQIIILPLNGKMIYLYNLDNSKWDYIKINESSCPNKFLEGIVVGDNLYAFGHWYTEIVKVELNNLSIKYFSLPKPENMIRELIGTQITKFGNNIYLPLCNSDKVIIFDDENDKYIEKVIGCDSKGYTAIQFCDNKFYLASRYGQKIVAWDGEKKGEIVFENMECEQDLYFHGIIPRKNCILFPSTHSKEILSINGKNHEFESIKEDILFCNIIDDGCYAIVDEKGNISIFDSEDMEYSCIISQKQIIDYFVEIDDKNFQINENNIFDLDFLLNYINQVKL